MALVYRCCFWFSLRLGAIITGILLGTQSLLLIIVSVIGICQPEQVKKIWDAYLNDLDYGFLTPLAQICDKEPDIIFKFLLTCETIHLVACVILVYGAYNMNTTLIYVYIICGILRACSALFFFVSMLIVIKKNNTDIGILIGASIGSGCVLFYGLYLLVCVMCLPKVINETEAEIMEARIIHLERLLELQKSRTLLQQDYDLVPAFSGAQPIIRANNYNIRDDSRLRNIHSMRL